MGLIKNAIGVFFCVNFCTGIMSVRFSDLLIKEYQNEMYDTYGVLVSEIDAQTQLLSLVRCMFPPIALQGSGGNEVGASITPTSGQINKN